MSAADHLLPVDDAVRQGTAQVDESANPPGESPKQPDQDASSLCPECKSIFDHWYDRDTWATARPGHSHHHIVGLQKSSQSGCSVCVLFLQGLSESNVNTLTQDWPYLKSLVSVNSRPYTRGYVKNVYRIDLVFQFHESDCKKTLETSLDAFASGKRTELKLLVLLTSP